jgi:hypothetical protein
MLMGDIKSGGQKILMVCPGDLGWALARELLQMGNSLVVLQESTDANGDLTISREIDPHSCLWEKMDGVVLCQRFFGSQDDFFKLVVKKIEKTQKDVFLDMEIVHTIYPASKWVAILSDGFCDPLDRLLKYLLKGEMMDMIKLSLEQSACASGGLLTSSSIFLVELSPRLLQYSKNLNNLDFDVFLLLMADWLPQWQDSLRASLGEHSRIMVNMDNEIMESFWQVLEKTADVPVISRIPLSITRMVEGGYSYVLETIYNYRHTNLSYDVSGGDVIKGNSHKLFVLVAFSICCQFGFDPLVISKRLRSFEGIPHSMECVGKYQNIVFLDNTYLGSHTMLEDPFKIYSNIYVIFLVGHSILPELLGRMKNYRKKIREVYVVDKLDILTISMEGFGSLKPIKVMQLKEAFAAVLERIATSDVNEEEIIVLVSPIFGAILSDNSYGDWGNEFRRLVQEKTTG